MDKVDMERAWANRVQRFLKAELKRAEVTYSELVCRLGEHGLEETEVSVASKLSRGTFAATFFLAAMKAIGAEHVQLEDV